jgi:hypothetical protein
MCSTWFYQNASQGRQDASNGSYDPRRNIFGVWVCHILVLLTDRSVTA